MNALNLGTILSAGTAQLPYVAILDIGPSSAGLISLIRDALPLERRHEALHFKLRMTPDYAINPFDTQLGLPLSVAGRTRLSDRTSYACSARRRAGRSPMTAWRSWSGFASTKCIAGATTAARIPKPRPYLVRVEAEVDEALAQATISICRHDPYWWDVVDALFDKGAHHEAMLAQRHAVPTLVDAVTAARRPQIRALAGRNADRRFGGNRHSRFRAHDCVRRSANFRFWLR